MFVPVSGRTEDMSRPTPTRGPGTPCEPPPHICDSDSLAATNSHEDVRVTSVRQVSRVDLSLRHRTESWGEGTGGDGGVGSREV